MTNVTDIRKRALHMTHRSGNDSFGVLTATYRDKAANLVAHGRRYPLSRPPLRFQDGPLIWQEADEAAALGTGPAAVHAILSLPAGSDHASERLLVEFIDAEIISRGAVTDWAIHALADENVGWSVHPHAYLLITCRRWRDDQQNRKDRPQPQWWATKDQRTALSSAWCRVGRARPWVRSSGQPECSPTSSTEPDPTHGAWRCSWPCPAVMAGR